MFILVTISKSPAASQTPMAKHHFSLTVHLLPYTVTSTTPYMRCLKYHRTACGNQCTHKPSTLFHNCRVGEGVGSQSVVVCVAKGPLSWRQELTVGFIDSY